MAHKQVWSSKNGMEVDDVWDDTELIKMYEESIKEVCKQPKNGVTERKFTGDDGKVYLWKVGGKCMAPYEENGKTEYYAATIDSIGGTDNLDVGVTFLYYGNQTVVHMKDLWENETAYAEAVELEKQQKQESSSKSESRKTVSQPTTSTSVFNMPPAVPLPSFAPPVPPNIVGMLPANEKEALSSMLMSWYMSGYHTGYYQALTDRRAEN